MSDEIVRFSNDGVSGQAVTLPLYGTATDPLNNPSHSLHHESLHNAILEIDAALSGGAGWNAGTTATAAGLGLIPNATVPTTLDVNVGTGLTITNDQVTVDPAILTSYVAKVGDTMTGNLAMTGNKVTNLIDSAIMNRTDAAPVWYIDQRATGVDPHGSVVAATSLVDGVLVLASPPAIIDGITLVVGDRILVKNQHTSLDPGMGGAQNGIYTYNGPGVALTRDPQENFEDALRPGSAVFVSDGTVNGRVVQICQMYDDQLPWTPDVDDNFWHLYSSRLELIPGQGLTLTGNILDVGVGVGLLATDVDISLDPAYQTPVNHTHPYLPLTGGALTGALDMGTNAITSLKYPTTPGAKSAEAANQLYVDEVITVDVGPPTAAPTRNGQLWIMVVP